MAQNTVSGSTTIKFLKQGDTINTLLISTKPLVQYVKTDPVVATPDWTIELNQPVIYPRITSQLSDTVITAITEDQWFYDDTLLAFTNGISSDGNFKKTTYPVNGTSLPALQITKNIMALSTAAKVIKFVGKVKTGGIDTQVSATISVTRSEISGDVYAGYISATNGGVVTQDNKNTILTALLLKGGNQVTTGITYVWYRLDLNDTDAVKDNWQPLNITTKNITINVSDVNTQETYRCAMSVGGSVVANAFFDVRDESDPLYILHNPSQKAEELSYFQQSITYTPAVRRRGASVNESNWTFSYILLNAQGTSVRTGSGASFTITYQQIEAQSGDLTLDITASKP